MAEEYIYFKRYNILIGSIKASIGLHMLQLPHKHCGHVVINCIITMFLENGNKYGHVHHLYKNVANELINVFEAQMCEIKFDEYNNKFKFYATPQLTGDDGIELSIDCIFIPTKFTHHQLDICKEYIANTETINGFILK